MQTINGATKYTIREMGKMLSTKRRKLIALGMAIDEEYLIVSDGVTSLAIQYHDSDNNIDYWSMAL